MVLDVYFEAGALLGEGPVWDSRTNELHWVDIERGEIHRREHASGAHHVVKLDETVGSAVPLRSGRGWIVGLRNGVAVVDLTGNVTQSLSVDAERRSHRMNDGACDSQGRFWTGTMNEAGGPRSDALYRVDPKMTVAKVVDGVGLSNGLAWAPDNRMMYRVDSAIRTIFQAEFAPRSGEMAEERVFVVVDAEAGVPDGIAVDAEGHVWVALWDGWAVHRYAPTGELELVLAAPVARPTSCTFGGAHLQTLFITTATTGLSADELSRQPFAGSILCAATEVDGLPANFFGY